MTGKQLKNSILQLAIQGKLVPQDPHDEPASELLKRIRKEKEQLVKTGKLKKKDLESTPIAEDEKPFEIPETWEWCRFEEIATFINGDRSKNYPNKSEYVQYGIAWINTGHITSNGYLTEDNMNYISKEKFDSLSSGKIERGDLVYCLRGATYGKISRVEPYAIGAVASSLTIIRCVDIKIREFIFWFLKSSFAKEQLLSFANGAAQPNLAAKDVAKYYIPLPPLSEQHRIVEKIEELMPLVEEYDKAQSELDKLNESLPEQLKKSILQQAIMGKLVPQDPNDEPASELLKRIHKEKENLVKSGALKKKDLITTPISDDEKPFDIPEGWEWIRIKDISNLVTKGTTPRGGNVAYVEKGVGFLRAENVSNMLNLDLTNLKYIDEKTHLGFLKRSILKKNDFLITIAGSLGRTAIVKSEDLPLNMNQAISVVRFTDIQQICLQYIALAINSPVIQEKLLSQTKITAIPNLTLEIISDCTIPLPPLSEQHRIVAKIEELFSILK